LLLMMRLLGALAASALFLENSGEMLSWRHPEDCVAKGMWDGVFQKVWLGLLSSLVATIPLVAVSALNRRAFVFDEDWNCEKRKRYVQYWRRMDYILWSIGLLYVVACSFFVICFLANITDEDQAGWMVSAVTTLVMTFVLKPILVAGLHASVVTVAEVWRPEVMDQARLQLGIRVGKAETVDHNAQIPVLLGGSMTKTVGQGKESSKYDNVDGEIDPTIMEEGRAREDLACRAVADEDASRSAAFETENPAVCPLPAVGEEGNARIPNTIKPFRRFFLKDGSTEALRLSCDTSKEQQEEIPDEPRIMDIRP